MKVYTYYHKVPEIDETEQWKEIAIWSQSWAMYGWEPVVLLRGDVPASAAEAERVIRARPTFNIPEYTVATSLRWFAFEAKGGGWIGDYDVINVGLTPERATEAVAGLDTAVLSRCWVPACVYATADGAHKLARMILENPGNALATVCGKPHISDMWIFQASPPGPALGLSREPQHPDNGELLIHVPNCRVRQLGWKGPRSEFMAKLLEEHDAPKGET